MSRIHRYLYFHFLKRAGFRGRRAFATVLVLLVVVLLSALIVAFLSMSQTNRGLSSSTAATVSVEQLSHVALDTIQADLLDEITSNSTTVGTGSNTYYVLPKVSGTGAIIAAAAVPQRVVTSGSDLPAVEPNVVKISRVSQPAWYLLTGSTSVSTTGTSNGPVRVLPAASGSSRSDISSANSIQITPSRWAKPVLFTSGTGLPASFVPPDWVILTGTGAIDTRTATPAIGTLSDPKDPGHALGRYAYVVYNVGGLIDITVAGNQLDNATNGVRFRENQIPLNLLQSGTLATTGTANSCILDGTSITTWRDTQALASGTGYLLGGTSTFTTLQPGQQTFVNRQDLLNFQKKNPTWMTPAALQYLTIFSRSLDRPQFTIPSIVNAVVPPTSSVDVDYTNSSTFKNSPEFLGVQRSDGSLVMKNRFPLSRLALFNNPTTNAADIKKYFGLERASDGYSWVYTSGTAATTVRNTPILTLAQVAALSPSREPDFFEVLLAAILNGSLASGGRGGWMGVSGTLSPDYYGPPSFASNWGANGENVVESRFRDNNLEWHVLQIGANLIDQVDSDDMPTIIQRELRGQTMSASATSIRNITIRDDIAGVENIPYLSDFMIRSYRLSDTNNPLPERQWLGTWFHFEFWNPHQNAPQSGAGTVTPSKFRVVMTHGRFRGEYRMQNADGTPDTVDYKSPPNSTAGDQSTPEVDYYAAYNASADNTPYQIQFDNSPAFQDPQYLMPNKFNSFTPTNSSYYATQGILPRNETYASEGPSGMIGILGGGDLVLGNPYPSTTTIKCAKIVMTNNVDNSVTVSGTGRYTTWEVQFKDPVADKWHTYQQFGDFCREGNGGLGTPDDITAANTVQYSAWTDAGLYTHYTPARLDPRGERWGLAPLQGPNVNAPLTSANDAMAVGCPDNDKLFYMNNASWHSGHTHMFPMAENLRRATATLTTPYVADHDGVVRHGDADRSVAGNIVDPLSITDAARLRKRPVMLNRPFQTVAEMGYSFRDVPWKSLDFSNGNTTAGNGESGDSALLDFFTCEDPYGVAAGVTQPTALLRGKINLNTQQPTVLQALVNGSTLVAGGLTVPTVTAAQQYIDTTVTTGTSVNALINDLVARTKVVVTGTGVANVVVSGLSQPPTPLAKRGDLVPVMAMSGTTSGQTLKNISPIKAEKEGVIRALADMGDTQTWNLMIDVIVQGGRYPSRASTADARNFVVDAERRYWLHVAIDRYSGRVMECHLEVVDE